VGSRPQQSGCIDAALRRDSANPLKRAVHCRGKGAHTDYCLHRWHNGVGVLSFLPKTGRTHQIRVHCAYAGFPIVADSLYGRGAKTLSLLQPLLRPFAAGVIKCFSRHALHAYRLVFSHPVTGDRMDIFAPLPHDFRGALALFDSEVQGEIDSVINNQSN
jgi:23S rRNA pseudouridine1911/1915/1917 synthase